MIIIFDSLIELSLNHDQYLASQKSKCKSAVNSQLLPSCPEPQSTFIWNLAVNQLINELSILININQSINQP